MQKEHEPHTTHETHEPEDVSIRVKVPRSLHREAKGRAVLLGLTWDETIRQALAGWLTATAVGASRPPRQFKPAAPAAGLPDLEELLREEPLLDDGDS